ncbi:MAG: hypothetical protein J6N81_00980 [Treponema sp.]|jgi:hypothetical protein|uniref:hypothetical protein n=1 Tax=Treponema sp. TaxID=166 RepID=UPI001B097CB9|nr:hypothetical protein [Treponema sp.]MBO6218136.1 hypothetical protein [Treponema sp.]MBQ8679628.1 hypothetical protein [Treponema sp.]
MTETEIIFFTIKLFLGGIIAFLAIMLWSKTRDFSWMFLVFAAVTGYSAIVFDLLLKLGFVTAKEISILGNEIPLVQLVLSVVPSLFVIIAFIIMLSKSGRK